MGGMAKNKRLKVLLIILAILAVPFTIFIGGVFAAFLLEPLFGK